MRNGPAALVALTMCLCGPALAGELTVHRQMTPDEKPVFATVEAREIVPARVRTGGTVAEIAVRWGQEVARGERIATVGDPKLLLQQNGLIAEISALGVQLAQTDADFRRADTLAAVGAGSRVARDQLRTQSRVQRNMIDAKRAQLAVVAQQLKEGAVLAPTDGRVIDLPYTAGTVVGPGESLASIAVAGYVLRLLVPEEHARFLKAGDTVRFDASDIGGPGAPRREETGTIALVYPEIKDGRVTADATAAALGTYFVGERVRAEIGGAPRARVVVPAGAILTQFGLDYVRRKIGGDILQTPVQRGMPAPVPGMPDGIEILSGLQDGDTILTP